MSFDDIAAFPLCWPEGWPRTKAKVNGQFRQTTYSATLNLSEQLRLMGIGWFVLSTSIPLRRDGLPLSKPPVDGDHGAALYFTRKKRALCLACDKYWCIEDNIQAIAKTLEAMRGIERWGSTDLLDRAFTGFAALEARKRPHEILGIPETATIAQAKVAQRALAAVNHPDTGGDPNRMAEINAAFDEFQKERTK